MQAKVTRLEFRSLMKRIADLGSALKKHAQAKIVRARVEKWRMGRINVEILNMCDSSKSSEMTSRSSSFSSESSNEYSKRDKGGKTETG